jgi:hypothetical protein
MRMIPVTGGKDFPRAFGGCPDVACMDQCVEIDQSALLGSKPNELPVYLREYEYIIKASQEFAHATSE